MTRVLQRYARQSHESGAAKTFLAIDDADNKTILGFYSLAPSALAYADTPETVRRGLARHDVPGFRLPRIATHVRLQGQGLGGQLLAAAARRTVETLGCLTVGDITKHSADELLGMPNFGQTSLQELRAKLAELGLKLKNE